MYRKRNQTQKFDDVDEIARKIKEEHDKTEPLVPQKKEEKNKSTESNATTAKTAAKKHITRPKDQSLAILKKKSSQKIYRKKNKKMEHNNEKTKSNRNTADAQRKGRTDFRLPLDFFRRDI